MKVSIRLDVVCIYIIILKRHFADGACAEKLNQMHMVEIFIRTTMRRVARARLAISADQKESSLWFTGHFPNECFCNPSRLQNIFVFVKDIQNSDLVSIIWRILRQFTEFSIVQHVLR